MAFQFSGFTTIATGASTASQEIYAYTNTEDTVDSMLVADYFLPVYDQLKLGAFICLIGNGNYGYCYVNSLSSTSVTVQPFDPSGNGNVGGPATSTQYALPRYADETGQVLLNSGAILDNNNRLTSNALESGYTSTATSAGTLTLTAASTQQQFLTGTTTHSVVLPLNSTLAIGNTFKIVNLSTGVVTVKTDNGTTLQVITSGSYGFFTVTNLTDSLTSSWGVQYSDVGSGDVVGPTSATDNALVRFDTTTGKLIQNSSVIADDDGIVTASGFETGYATTVTTGGTVTLTAISKQQQFFTGTLTHTVLLPLVSTLALGNTYRIVNRSTGIVTVQSSGGNVVATLAQNTETTVTVIATSGTDASSWYNSPDSEIICYPVPISDESTAISGTGVVETCQNPYPAILTDVRAALTTGCTTGTFTISISQNGISILSTNLTIDAGETVSTTAAIPVVISNNVLLDFSTLTFNITNVGDGTATGAKVYLYLRRG